MEKPGQINDKQEENGAETFKMHQPEGELSMSGPKKKDG